MPKPPKAPKPPRIPESMIVNNCIRWLCANKCFIWRNNSGAYKPERSSAYVRFGLTGSADIIGITPGGQFIGVECKAKGGKQSDAQKAFQERIEEHNGIYILAYSIDDLESAKHRILGMNYGL